MDKKYITQAEAKRVLAAIKDPLVKAIAKRMFDRGERAGAALASMRKLDWHICLQCKELFSGIKTAKYCTNACRQTAKRERSLLTGKIIPRCHCGKAVYSDGKCYGHFQKR